jgi:hypothetical protein
MFSNVPVMIGLLASAQDSLIYQSRKYFLAVRQFTEELAMRSW